jgi:carbon monoxide dehydrogenase subunit G
VAGWLPLAAKGFIPDSGRPEQVPQMHYDGAFEVPVPKQKVYDFVMDPEKITSIFPDVQDVKVIDENNFTLKAKVGISFIRGMMDVKMNIAERTVVKWAADAKISGLMASVGSRLIDAAAQKYVTQIIGSLKEKLSSA